MAPDLIFKILGDRWFRGIVLLLLLAGLAHQVSLVVWQFVPAPQVATSLPPVAVTPTSQSTGNSTNYRQQAVSIGQAFLFGKPEAAPQPVAQVVEEAPETQLNYKLRGVYFSQDENLSSAIVETRPNDTRHYLLGQELADKITLARIEQDHILIDRYGKLERLNLQKPAVPGGRTASVSTGVGASANQTALLRSYKKRYIGNPMALATRFQAIPVQQDGNNIGFKLKALRGESLLKKLDFEADDVFTAVNGVALNNPFEALDALKSLTTANKVSVTFLRNGSEQTLDFEI